MKRLKDTEGGSWMVTGEGALVVSYGEIECRNLTVRVDKLGGWELPAD